MNILICSTIFLPMAAAILCYAAGRFHKTARDYLACAATGITFIICLYLAIQTINHNDSGILWEIPYVCGMGLHFTLDGFRGLYGTIAAFMWFMSTLFSREYFAHYHNRNRYYLFLLLTLGATEGVFFSADFYTTFIFFEIMSLTSYVWVAHDERKESLRAASTYLAVAVIGGLVMLMGIFLLYDTAGTLFFRDLSGILLRSSSSDSAQIWIVGLCLLFGFGAKAGAFPLHIWLPKAHPVAPAPASALLSGILTKAGMYGILILTACLFLGSSLWGGLILLLGVFTMVIGALLALLSIDLKRTLACSSVSQIGFILVGTGMSGLLGEDNVLAMRGSLLHMVNHSLIKLVLFMAAGVVFMNIHKLDLNEIRGFGRKKPLLHYIFLMGALGIGGIPLWNGYISKTLLHESIAEYMLLLRSGTITGFYSISFMKGVEWIFLISGGLTVAYMSKLYACLFLEKNTDASLQEKYDGMKHYMNKTSASVLVISAALLPLMGLLPGIIMDPVADMGQAFLQTGSLPEPLSYFSLKNLSGAAVSLFIGAFLYFVVVRFWLMKRTGQQKTERIYVNHLPHWMDLEELLYRPVLLKILPFTFGMICRFLDSLVDTIVVILRKTLLRDSKLPRELPQGTPLTHMCACIAAWIQWLGNQTIHKKHPRNQDYDHKFALFYEELSENSMMIARSMSFGLLLFCIGLILTVAYLFIKDVFGL